MTDGSTTMAPPLDGDLGSIDTSMPLLKDKEYYDFRIEKAEIKPTSKGGKMIALDFVTIAPSKSMDGKDLGTGIHVFDNLNIEPSGKATWEMVKRNVAKVLKSVFSPTSGFDWKSYGQTHEDRIKNAAAWVPRLMGQTLRVKVGYAPAESREGKAYREKNTIEVYVPKD